MNNDLQSRGFSLTPALREAVECEAGDFKLRFHRLMPRLSVRLFDVNGRRGGVDKGCLVRARVGRSGMTVVASALDENLYRAIPAAFEKLQRSTETVLGRMRSVRRANVAAPLSEW